MKTLNEYMSMSYKMEIVEDQDECRMQKMRKESGLEQR